MTERIYLSPPHLTGEEQVYVREAFDSNWIAPLGPNVDAFETEFAERVGSEHALALSSGTAALHLALLGLGVGSGDTVFVSNLTFVASVNPILYVGATPVLIDCDETSWNLDPNLLEDALRDAEKRGALPKAVIVVHLYGQSADLDAICDLCERYGVPLIEDAAEALGATYRGHAPGSFGMCGIFSFNGNKIITTSGGGMLVSDDPDLIAHARKLSTQAREDVPHYEHVEVGFNYRLSNILAGVGRGQLQVLDDRVEKRRANFDAYKAALSDLPGFAFQDEADWGTHSRWLTCLTIDPNSSEVDRETVRGALTDAQIEARPLWKPMHLQPLYRDALCFGGARSTELFERGLCLPSGSSLSDAQRDRVIETIRATSTR